MNDRDPFLPRDLVALVLVGAIGLYAWRGRGPPPLGPPHPQTSCAAPVEIIGEGVACELAGVPAGARVERHGSTTGAGEWVPRGRMAPARLAAFAAPIDLNRASAAELASLDGIGPRLAARIVAARPFARIDELERVRGIGHRRLEALRPRLMLPRLTLPRSAPPEMPADPDGDR